MAKFPAKKIVVKNATPDTEGLQCTMYANETDLPDTSNCIVGLLKSGDNGTDPDGPAEYIIEDGDGDDGHYVWWQGNNLSSGWVPVDFNIALFEDIAWAIDGTATFDDSLTFGDMTAVGISADVNAANVSIEWDGINVSFYDNNGVVHDSPGVPSDMWPEAGAGGNGGAVYITPSDTSIQYVRVHITGSVNLTRPNTNRLPDQAILGKVFIYANSDTSMRAALHPKRVAKRPK